MGRQSLLQTPGQQGMLPAEPLGRRQRTWLDLPAAPSGMQAASHMLAAAADLCPLMLEALLV